MRDWKQSYDFAMPLTVQSALAYAHTVPSVCTYTLADPPFTVALVFRGGWLRPRQDPLLYTTGEFLKCTKRWIRSAYKVKRKKYKIKPKQEHKVYPAHAHSAVVYQFSQTEYDPPEACLITHKRNSLKAIKVE